MGEARRKAETDWVLEQYVTRVILLHYDSKGRELSSEDKDVPGKWEPWNQHVRYAKVKGKRKRRVEKWSLRECINKWLGLKAFHYSGDEFQIHNMKTGEIIPCAVLV